MFIYEFIYESKSNIEEFIGNINETLESTEKEKVKKYHIQNFPTFMEVFTNNVDFVGNEKYLCHTNEINFITFDIEDAWHLYRNPRAATPDIRNLTLWFYTF